MIIIFKKFGVKMKYHFALLAAAVAAAAFAVFEPAIHTHHAVYDDAYVLGQRDLHMPFSEWLASGCSLRCFPHTPGSHPTHNELKSAPPRIYNDCWGTPMNSALSNQQWRPAVALGLRLSLRLAGCGPADIQAIHAHGLICQPSLLRQPFLRPAGRSAAAGKEPLRLGAAPLPCRSTSWDAGAACSLRCAAFCHCGRPAAHAASPGEQRKPAAWPLLSGRPHAGMRCAQATPFCLRHLPQAAAAAWLFALHPVHVESVITINGRADVQALALQQGAMLILWCCDGVTRAGPLPVVAALLLALLSTLSKENGVVTFLLLPCLVFSCRIAAASSGTGRAMRPNSAKFPAALAVASAAAFSVVLYARFTLVQPWGPPTSFLDNPAASAPRGRCGPGLHACARARDLSPALTRALAHSAARALSFGWLHVRYAEALILPWRQAVNHGRANPRPLCPTREQSPWHCDLSPA